MASGIRDLNSGHAVTVVFLLFLLLQTCANPCEDGVSGRRVQYCVITTPEHGVEGAKHLVSKCDVQKLQFDFSEIDNIPNDIHKGHNLIELLFTNSNMKEIPYGLIKTACHSLTTLHVHHCTIASQSLPNGGFPDCAKVKSLTVTFAGITSISAENFKGLSNLEHLSLKGNAIKTINRNVFHGLKMLANLDMQDNQLQSLEEGVFDDQKTLMRLELAGNPFICDCSLQWLKVWIESRNSPTEKQCQPFNNKRINCSTPIQEDITTLVICKVSQSNPTKKTSCAIPQMDALLQKSKKCCLPNLRPWPKKVCDFLKTLQTSSSTTRTREKRLQDCKLEQLFVPYLLRLNCTKSSDCIIKEDPCKSSTSIYSKEASLPKPNLEMQYRCHLEKTVARSYMVGSCERQNDDTSPKFCKYTTTSLPNTKAVANSKLENRFCARISQMRMKC